MPRMPLRAHHQPRGPRARVGDQRPEAQLLHRDAKLGQLGLVHAYEVVVRLGHLGHVVLQRADDRVLVLQHLLQPRVDGGQRGGVQVGGGQHLGQLRFLHLQRLAQRLQPPLQQRALQPALLRHLVDGRLEALVQLVALARHLAEPLRQHLVLPLQVLDLLLRRHQPRLGLRQAQLVLLVAGQRLAQRLHLLQRLAQRFAQPLVLLRNLKHELLVLRLALLHLRHVVLERLDQVQVVVRDIVVVVLDLCEGALVLLHELVDVRVLALLDLVDLLLAPQLHVVAQHLHLLLVLLLQLARLQLELLPQLGDLLGVLQPRLAHNVLVGQLLLLDHQLEVALVLAQLALALAELVLLQLERQLAVRLERGDVVLVLVQQVLHLLLVHLDLHLVPLLHLLHLAIFIPQLCPPVIQVLLGNLPKGIDFISLQLHVVAVFLLLILFLL
mmetsp:Transcript_4183/g.10446  ORF Transcript_4183/g.10446 Transcript_4183/m.10446 type:complete len:441 (-) Transcript_4183:302-1624(-)